MKALIHAHGRWIKPSSAIWNCTVDLSGEVQLDGLYPQLRAFFVNKLDVKLMNPNLLLQKMAQLAADTSASLRPANAMVEEMKLIMQAAGQILSVDRDDAKLKEDVRALRKIKFLPVRSNRGYRFEKVSGEFFIVDHERFGNAFKGQLDLLDFSYSDMTSLAPLFQVLELEHRYLSGHVEAKTAVEAEEFNNDLSNHFRNRAYAFSW